MYQSSMLNLRRNFKWKVTQIFKACISGKRNMNLSYQLECFTLKWKVNDHFFILASVMIVIHNSLLLTRLLTPSWWSPSLLGYYWVQNYISMLTSVLDSSWKTNLILTYYLGSVCWICVTFLINAAFETLSFSFNLGLCNGKSRGPWRQIE